MTLVNYKACYKIFGGFWVGNQTKNMAKYAEIQKILARPHKQKDKRIIIYLHKKLLEIEL